MCVVDAARRSGGCSGSATWAVFDIMGDGTKEDPELLDAPRDVYLEASPLERLFIRLPQDRADT